MDKLTLILSALLSSFTSCAVLLCHALLLRPTCSQFINLPWGIYTNCVEVPEGTADALLIDQKGSRRPDDLPC